jgi:hypothetical protein
MGVGLRAGAGLRPLPPEDEDERGAEPLPDVRGLPPSMRDQVGPDPAPDLPDGFLAADD